MSEQVLTIGGVLERAARLWPDKEAVIADERRVTYAQLDEMANRLANALSQMGITRGDRVAVMLPNWPEFVCAYYAVARMGVVIVPMNTRFRRREVEHIVSETGASALIVVDQFLGFDYVDLVRELWPKLPSLRHVIVKGEHLAPGMVSFDAVLSQADGRAPVQTDPSRSPTVEDVLSISYTSGTTGRAKGAVIKQIVPLATAAEYKRIWAVTEDDTVLITLGASQMPVFGGFVLSSTLAGMRMVMLPRFKADAALELVERERVTYLIGVPTMWVMYLAELEVGDYDISSLRLGFTAGAPCPLEVARSVEERMGCRLFIAYGMTETSGHGTATRADDPPDKRLSTVGRPLSGFELAIVDQEHNPVPTGERGEIAFRGRALFSGYYERPEATAKVLDGDGWFYTGDLGVADEQGFLQITGRSTDMILRGGYNVYAAEVETCLLSHPNVVNAAVFGLPDPVLGETVHAQVIRRDGASVTSRELLDFCRQEIASYKAPDEIKFVSEFPLSSLGKVQKYIVRDQALRELGARVE